MSFCVVVAERLLISANLRQFVRIKGFFQLFQLVAYFVKLTQTYEKLSCGLDLYSYLVNMENSTNLTFSRILYE